MKPFFGFWPVLGAMACLFSVSASAAPAAGDAQAKKTVQATMEKEYMGGDFDGAERKLKAAEASCEKQGCSPSVWADINANLAVVHWVGMEKMSAGKEDLRAVVQYDPRYKMTDDYASPDLIAALDAIRKEEAAAAAAAPKQMTPAAAVAPAPAPTVNEFQKQVDARKKQYAREAEEAQKEAEAADARRQAEEELAIAARKTEDAKKAAADKKEAARKAEEDRKAEAARLADEKKEAQRKAAEEKKAEQARKAEEAKKAADEKKEAQRKAAEEKKAEQARKAEEAKKAEEERKEAAKKAAEEKKEAQRKAAEEKKEAQRKAAEDKKEAQRKAAEDKKEAKRLASVEAARKVEEARQAKEDARMRTPPPVGKMQETLWREQTIGYPVPVYVKLPPPPQGIEPPRVEVVKVVTEYSAPSSATPQQLELKPLAGGGYGGLLPCDVSAKEGDISFYTTALNKYDNPVARSGSPDKPNRIHINSNFTGSFPHLPGELPPKACEQSAAKIAPTSCQNNSECPDGFTCSKEGCVAAGAADAPAMANPTPKSGGCAGCRVGRANSEAPLGATGLVALAGALLLRRRRRAA